MQTTSPQPKKEPVFPAFENEEIVLKVLNDSIIWYRVVEHFESAMRAFDPRSQDDQFTPSLNYLGFAIAFDLMGLGCKKYSHLRDELYEIGWQYTEKDTPSDLLARDLYFRWIYEAKEKIDSIPPIYN